MAERFEIKINPAVNHTSVRVKNLEESIRFYHQVVGLPIIRQAGPADNPTIVWLPGIELSQRSEGEDTDAPAFFGHIGLAVENIEEACQHLREQGIEFDTPLKEVIFEEMGQRLKLAFFRDPDGISVEFVHWREL